MIWKQAFLSLQEKLVEFSYCESYLIEVENQLRNVAVLQLLVSKVVGEAQNLPFFFTVTVPFPTRRSNSPKTDFVPMLELWIPYRVNIF